MYLQMIKDLRDFYTENQSTNSFATSSSLTITETKLKMSSADDVDEISSSSSHSTDAFLYESFKQDNKIVNSQLNESLKYKNLVENLEISKREYTNFKSTLNKPEDVELLSQIEEKLNQISEFKIDLLKAKYQDEINLKVSSIKLVMEKMNMASMKWSNEEYESKISKMKQELDLNNKIIGDYEIKIKDLNHQVKAYKNKLDVNSEDLELEMRPLEDENESDIIVNNRFDYLKDEIKEKNEIIENLRVQEDIYINEINRLKSQLNDCMEISNYSRANTTMTNFDFESVLMNTTSESVYREPKIVNTQVNNNRVNDLVAEIERKEFVIQKLNQDFLKFKEEVETMSHPLFAELQGEMQKSFDEEYEDLKLCYENKLREELEIYKNIYEQKIESIKSENKQSIIDIEAKHKLELKQLKIEFENILSLNLQDLKKELEKTQKDNKGVSIKFKYTTEHHSKEISNLLSNQYLSDYLNENELNTIVLDSAQNKKISVTKLNDQENTNDKNKKLETFVQQMPLNLETSNSNISFTEDEEPVSNSYHKKIQVETSSVDFKPVNGSNKLIEFDTEPTRPIEVEEKIRQLEVKNKNLQGTLESLYAKDDIYMASYRRENEERENYIKLLQADIQHITDEKNTLLANNQNLLNLLSKSFMISASLDDHIVKRLNKISHNQIDGFRSQNSRVQSPKCSTHLSSTESGLHGSSSGSSEVGSNEDISEEGLDTSQRIYDNNEFTDESLIDTNLKIQTSIDKVLNALEETSKQLADSNSLQIQLAYKFEENQKILDDYKNRYQNLEFDYEEKLAELQKKLNNFEGLVDAYELEIQQKRNVITQLEQNLNDTRYELSHARHVIENEKTELSNMEVRRKDLEAQRSLYVNNLQDSDIKEMPINNNKSPNNELILNNSYLLDEKHELEYKLNKTNEISQQQIKDLEETVENFNEEIRNIRDNYEEQLDDLKRQISSMDSQIRSDKAFIDQQMAEREQEREEYESKIIELKKNLSRKSSQVLESEDMSLKECAHEFEMKRKDLEDMIQEKTDRLHQLSLENENLERVLTEKGEQVNKMLKQIKDLEFKIDGLNMEKSNCENQNEQFKMEIDTLMKSNKNQVNVINDLREKLTDIQAKYDTQFEMNENWAIEKEDLIQQKNDLQTEMYNYMSRVSDLQLFKENFEMESKNRIEKYEETIASLNSNLDDKDNLIDTLKEQLNELKQDFQNRLEAEIKQLEYVEDKQNNDLIKSYEDQIDVHKKEIEILKNELKLKEQFEVSQNLLDSKNLQIDELNAKIEQLEKEVHMLKESKENAQNEIEILKNLQSSKLNELEEDLKNQIESLSDQLDSLSIEKNAIQSQNDSHKTEILNLKELNEEYKDKLDKVSIENRTFRQEIEQTSDQLNAKEESIRNLNLEINDLKLKLIESEQQINFFKVDLSNLKQEFDHKTSQDDLKQQYDSDIETLTKEIENITQDNDELRTKLESTRNDFQQENTKLIIKNEDLRNENDILKRNNNELNNLITELNSKLEELVEQNKLDLEQKLDEFNSIHKQELENMNDSSLNEIKKLKAEHVQQVEELKKEHERLLHDEIDRVRKELVDEYEKQIEMLKDTLEKDDTDSDKLVSIDASISNDNFKKLKEQIQLTKELDKDILDKMNENNQDERAIPDEIKEILEKLDNEGVLLLSLSEILMLKSHFKNKLDDELNKHTEQAEKDQLIQEIYQLKELLSKLTSESQPDDWRSLYLNAISDIFLNQKELLLSELRSFVCNGCYTNSENHLVHLENKIDNLASLQQKSYDYLKSIDRESLVKEAESIKNELNKVMGELNQLQENERQLKRELKLMEYAKDAEIIKANDLKQSLNHEKSNTLDLIEKLNQEKKKTHLMQEQLSELNEEVVKIKDHLNAEASNFHTLCKELDNEKSKNEHLKSLIETKNKQDESDLRKESTRHLKVNNSDDYVKQTNANNKKLMILEQQFIELEKHTNNLDQLVIQERAKNEKIMKAYHDLKAKYMNIGTLNSSNNLERIRQSLEYLAIKHKDEIDSSTRPVPSDVKSNLNSIINELENVSSMSSNITSNNGQTQNSSDLETKLLRQNRELLSSIKKLTNEKLELRNRIQKVDEELWLSRNQIQKVRNDNHTMSEYDKDKFKKLYYKYLRAESFRKSLVYQKRFLLIMLSGYEETEREIMTTLKIETTSSNFLKTNSKYGQLQEQNKNGSFYYSNRFTVQKAKSRFRTGAICIIAINRIKFLQRKHSYMATRVDTYRSN